MSNDIIISHYEETKKDIRDEIKRRSSQRNQYSIQLTIALSAIFTFSFSGESFEKAILAAPLVSIYYTVLILYSYRVHKILATYLKVQIEPELARRLNISRDIEWENYYSMEALPGIRRHFFIYQLWVVLVISLGYLWTVYFFGKDILSVGIIKDDIFRTFLIFYTVICITASRFITKEFWVK